MAWGDDDQPAAFGARDADAFAAFGDGDAPAFGERDAEAFPPDDKQPFVPLPREHFEPEARAALDWIEARRRAKAEHRAAPPAMPHDRRPGIGKQFGNDIARSVDQLQALGYGLTALGADAIGWDWAADRGLEGYMRNQEEAKANPPVIGTFRNISTDGPGEFAADAGRYAVEAVGENALMMAPSLVTGGVGALAARKAAEKAAQAKIADVIAKGVAKEVAEREAAALINKRVAAGGMAGAYPSAAGLEMGSIYGDIYEKTGQRRPGVATVGGMVAGLFDVIPEAGIFKKVLGERVGGEVVGHIVKRLGVEGAKQFMKEAPTEAIQTIIERASVAYVDPSKEVFSGEGVDEIIDSFLKGGLAGGIVGAGAEALLRADLATAERAVLRLIKVPLGDGQFDALVDFAFNLGGGSLQRSTLRAKVNRGEHADVPAELMKWVKGGGRLLPGLVRRRRAEAALYVG